MHDYQIRISDAIIQAPWWWFDALLIWLAAMGAILWLFGRRLVRPALAAVGLLLGAGLMLIFTSLLIVPQWPEAPVIPLIIVGAIVGALVAFILWRLAIGLSLGLLVAILAPAVGLALLQIDLPEYGPVVEKASTELNAYLRPPPDTAEPAADPQPIPPIIEPLSAIWRDAIEATRTWWESTSASTVWIFALLCLGGGSVAALLGFAMPVLSASLITAVLGGAAMLALVYRIFWHMGSGAPDVLPQTASGIVLLVLVISVVGVFVQWLFRGGSRREER